MTSERELFVQILEETTRAARELFDRHQQCHARQAELLDRQGQFIEALLSIVYSKHRDDGLVAEKPASKDSIN